MFYKSICSELLLFLTTSVMKLAILCVSKFSPFFVQSLVVEYDALEVVQAVLDPSEYKGTSAVVIDDCQHLLSMLGMATIQHCP